MKPRNMKMRKPVFWKNYHLMDKSLFDVIQYSTYSLMGVFTLSLFGLIFI